MHSALSCARDSAGALWWMLRKKEEQIVRATVVGQNMEQSAEQNAVLAGDPKIIRLLCNTNLITNIPSRGSEEERIRIHLQVRPNIQSNGYKG